MDELRECPWCGDNEPTIDDIYSNIYGRIYTVFCTKCERGVEGAKGSRQAAVAAWNALSRGQGKITYDGTDSTLPDEERVYLIGHQSTGRLSRDWQKPCWWVDADHDFWPLKIGDEWTSLLGEK